MAPVLVNDMQASQHPHPQPQKMRNVLKRMQKQILDIFVSQNFGHGDFYMAI